MAADSWIFLNFGSSCIFVSFSEETHLKYRFFSHFLWFVGEHLEKLIPMVVKFTGVEDDELREYCFQAFEAFIRRYTQSHVSITLGDNIFTLISHRVTLTITRSSTDLTLF